MSYCPKCRNTLPNCGCLAPASPTRDKEIERLTAELAKVRKELGEAQQLRHPANLNDVLRLRERAESAEAKNTHLAAQVAVMEVALQYYANGGHYEIETPESPITLLDDGEVAEKALATAPAKAEKLVRVVEAVKEYDTAISTLEKDHGRKDMELTQHSKLIPVRELSRDL